MKPTGIVWRLELWMSEPLWYRGTQFSLLKQSCLIRSSTPSCPTSWTATHSGRARTCRWLVRMLGSCLVADCRSQLRCNISWRFWLKPGDYCRSVSSTPRFPHSWLATSFSSSTRHSSTHSWKEVQVCQCLQSVFVSWYIDRQADSFILRWPAPWWQSRAWQWL